MIIGWNYQQFMEGAPNKLEYLKTMGIPWGYSSEGKLEPNEARLAHYVAGGHGALENAIKNTPKTDTIVLILTKHYKQVEDFETFLKTRPWVEATLHTPKGVTNDVHPERKNNLVLYTVKGAKE